MLRSRTVGAAQEGSNNKAEAHKQPEELAGPRRRSHECLLSPVELP